MVRCWLMQSGLCSSSADQSSLEPIDLESVIASTGITYHYIDPHDYRADVDRLSRQNSYKREDIIDVRPGLLKDFHDMMTKFRTEHHHPDEEVRFALKGRGYFDVRNQRDQWIRIEVTPGDFLILPPGIYHRFQFHEEEIGITFLRLFQDDEPYRIFFRANNKERKQQAEQANITLPQAAY